VGLAVKNEPVAGIESGVAQQYRNLPYVATLKAT